MWPEADAAVALTALAVLAGACIQGTGGIGFALFAAPVVALVRPELVPGPMLVLGGAVSLLAALREWRHIDYRAAAIAFAGRVPGSLAAGLAIGLPHRCSASPASPPGSWEPSHRSARRPWGW